MRVGLAAGGGGAVLVFAAQPFIGIAALVVVVLAGMLAGLAVAKWLPREWFGRQLESGLRSGLLACGLAAVGFLASLLFYGRHAINSLAASSHLPGFDLAPVVRALGFAGWLGVGIIGAFCAVAVGTALAAVAAQLGSWGKTREAILAVERAREAAQRSVRLSGGSGGRPSTARATTPALSTPLPASTRNGAPLSGGLGGLNESFYSMRSPLSMVPPPAPAAQPSSNGYAAPAAPPDPQSASAQPPLIDAASLVDADADLPSSEPPLESAAFAAEAWSAFATWNEPPPAPAVPVAPGASEQDAVIIFEAPAGTADDGELDPLAGEDDPTADELDEGPPSGAPRARPDTDSWLC